VSRLSQAGEPAKKLLTVSNQTLLLLLLLLLLLAIFVLDLATPLGYAVWPLYLIPVILASRLPNPRSVFLFTAGCCGLTVIGYFLSPTGIESKVALFNRTVGITVLWVTAVLLRQRKQAEEDRARLFTLSVDMLCIADSAGSFKQVNPAWEKTLGWTDDELRSKPYLDFVHPDDREPTIQAAAKLKAGAMITTFENRYRCKDGSYRWLHWSAAPLAEEGLVFAVARDITARKQVEEEIRKSQQRLRNLIDGLGSSMFVGVLTPDGTLIEANRPALAVAGLKPEDVLGKPLEETYWLAYSEEVKHQVREAIGRAARGEASRYDMQIRASENQFITVDFSLQPSRDETGQVVFLIPSARDITERKHAEEALRKAHDELEQRVRERTAELTRVNAELQGILDASTEVAIIAGDPNKAITVFNPGAERMLGYRADEIVGKHTPALFHLESEVRARAQELTEQLGHSVKWGDVFIEYAKHGGFEEREWTYVRKDGRHLTVSLIVTAVRDPEGRILSYLGIATDITARRKAEEAQRRLAAIVESSDDAILSKTLDGIVTSWNKGAERLFGYTAEEVMGIPITILLPADRLDEETMILARLRQGERIEHFETTRRAKDGRLIDVSLTISPIMDERGAVIGISKIARNITARKRAERALQETNAELDAFAYTISHDLRAPLRALQGFAQALREDYADRLDETGKEYAGRLVAAAHRMDGLIQDLLAYSRLSRTDIQLRPVNLDTVLTDVQTQLQTIIQERRAQITVEQPLPTVLGHAPTLAHVLANLVTNALKFVEKGVSPHVAIRADSNNGRVRVWVEDNGIGIAPEHQERIFRVFERLHGIEAYPGTGVGLAIVRKGVERMGGRSGVESEVGKGSRFWIELPESGSH
jgi:PAS domain S-box-containing protein